MANNPVKLISTLYDVINGKVSPDEAVKKYNLK
jgi:hypothetical protein